MAPETKAAEGENGPRWDLPGRAKAEADDSALGLWFDDSVDGAALELGTVWSRSWFSDQISVMV